MTKSWVLPTQTMATENKTQKTEIISMHLWIQWTLSDVIQWVYQPCRRKAPEDLESDFHLGGKVPRVQAVQVQVKINRALTRKIEDNWTTYQNILVFIEKNLQSTESPNRAMAPFGVCDCHKPCKEWSARLPLGLALAHTMAIPMASMTKPCGVLQAMRFWKKPFSLIRVISWMFFSSQNLST